MNIVELKKKVCDRIDQRRDEMIRVAQRMLKRPELGSREVKTAAIVKEKLNLSIREGLALTGVEGTLSGKEAGPTVVVVISRSNRDCQFPPEIFHSERFL